jgi:ABC-2 type transport system ATP-binding protein
MAEIAVLDEQSVDQQRSGPGPVQSDMIDVKGLTKRYSGRPVNAVDGITFSVRWGEVFGLLGPNGAGKTTTIGVLTTRVQPTGGQALIAGLDVLKDPVGVKPYIAVVPQRNNLDRALTAIENLTFHAAYFGMSRAKRHERALRLLKEFGLADRANDKIPTYSGGMAQRLLIARALMHEPQLLFLDEPTTGLDPQARLFLWDTIQSFNQSGLTILLTTHDMEEAEKLCHRVAIMDKGKILALGTPANLSQLVPAGTRIELTVATPEGSAPSPERKSFLLDRVRSLTGVTSAEWAQVSPRDSGAAQAPWFQAGGFGPGRPGPGGGPPPGMAFAGGASKPSAPTSDAAAMLRLYAEKPGELSVRAAQIVLEAGLDLADLHLAKPSLEDVFIHLTGRGLRD